MKTGLLIVFLLLCGHLTVWSQSNCNNRDFEDTTFVNWVGSTGTNTGLLTTLSYTNGWVSNGLDASISDALARHTLITQNYIDTNCIDPVTLTYDTFMTALAPGGGTVSVRLGNSQVGMEMERIGHAYSVTGTNPIYTFQYACVQNDPGHNWDAQPFFMANVYDATGGFLTGDTIYAGQQNVPFIPSPNGNKYRRWSTISFDLSPYIGQNVYIEFVNSDCAFGGHYGYTYLDVSCIGALTPSVWPGDCDYDLHCNYVDGLSLGIAFGSTGTARTTMGNNWVATASTDWSTHFPLGVDYKHADCDGNGTVGWSDVQAIVQNYGSTHPFKPGVSNGLPETASKAASLPVLTLVPSVTVTGPSNVVTYDIRLGSSSIPVQNLYGIGFNLQYDENLIQSGSASGNFTGVWLGVPNQSVLSVFHSQTGQSDFVICKINQQDTTGYGSLGTFQITTTAALTSNQTLTLTPQGIVAIDQNMVRVPVKSQSVSITLDPNMPVGVVPGVDVPEFSIYPNPARTEVRVKLDHFRPAMIRVYSLAGMVLKMERVMATETLLEMSDLADGMYWMEVSDEKGKSVRPLAILRQ